MSHWTDKFRLDAGEAVLMVIDIQERLVPAIAQGQRVIDRTAILITVAERLGIPIIAIEMYPKGLGKTVAPLADKLQAADRFEKVTFSALTEDVRSCLAAMEGRRKVIVAGMETHVCVFQSVRDLLRQDYLPFVAADAVGSRSTANNANGLDLMREMGAVITNVETIFFDLMQRAATPLFRELSPLIK
ncbi:isochorismatase family protein [Heliobacterium gestii]|uniref:Isochorismatase family protein n=1 Tax=Heliomicrobium gestii TaxID=2699 RepID=A0A845LH17_HELGE|nr:isochorismatase family protein [Heliomicrobium gestii]MBM7866453.1 nicotinamidase-related amidase [Heliomicrobium gestii]MZP42763.1 isochorismatase family protein [Heliomicrobium gestii]